jgi:secreted trypsin-like serine protease
MRHASVFSKERCAWVVVAVSIALLMVVSVKSSNLTAQAAPRTPRFPVPMTIPEILVKGGLPANPPLTNWQVALVSKSLPHIQGLFCGGTIIGSNWVLTAAHCFFDEKTCERDRKDDDFFIAYGTVHLGQRATLESAKKVYFPEQWNCKKGREADIALVQLQEAVRGEFTTSITLASHSQTDQAIQRRTEFKITGWGAINNGQGKSINLMEASVPHVDQKFCKQAYADRLPKQSICAGNETKDACTGDSGGPLFVRDEKNKSAIQFGVVSFGEGCGRKGFPGVYTVVSAFNDWIDKTRKANSCTPADIQNKLC